MTHRPPHDPAPRRAPHTRASLAGQLAELGLTRGATVLVHAAMKPLGPVAAPDGPADPAAATLLGALTDAVGRHGTVVVPSFTEANSRTSRIHRERTRGMDPDRLAAYYAAMPPYDPETTGASTGRLAETLRRAPGARRSGHPQTSFAALGARAGEAVARHDEDCHLGEATPLGWLYKNDAVIVMIGVDYDVCTAFHLAEYRIPGVPRRAYECVIRRAGRPEWITYDDIALDDSDFGKLGTAYGNIRPTRHDGPAAPASPVRSGAVGDAAARLLVLRDAVDFATGWLSENRPVGDATAH